MKIVMKQIVLTVGLFIGLVGFAEQPANYHFLISEQQKSFTCGYYALANAHAVQQLFNTNNSINQKNIGLLTTETLTNFFAPFFEEEFNQLPVALKRQHGTMLRYAESQTDLLDFYNTVSFTSTQLENDNLQTTIDCNFFTMLSNENNQLENAYTIQYVPKERAEKPIFIVATNNQDPYGTVLQNIKNVNKKIVHFLYNIGSDKSGHWVYIGVIKLPNQDPFILHLNSTNNNSYKTSEEFREIVHHIQHCIDTQDVLMSEYIESEKSILTQEDEDLAKTIQASLDDTYQPLTAEQNDYAYAQQAQQEEDDAFFAQQLQEKENQEQEDYDYALALSLDEEEYD